MPHFIMECSEGVLHKQSARTLCGEVFEVARQSGLFREGDIKARVRSFPEDRSTVAGTSSDFIHVFAHVMGGRSEAQKETLSRAVVGRLVELLPEVPVISMNVTDFDPTSYHNRNSVARDSPQS